MKRTYILGIILTAWLAVSCDMDKEPVGMLNDGDAIESPDDCRSYRNGLYATLRYLTTGSFIYLSDLQVDQFHAVTGNGNPTGSGLNSGTLLTNSSEFETIWGGYYGMIGSTNFLISKIVPLLESNTFTEQENIEMRRYMGEAIFLRAYCYYYLVERFCPVYRAETANIPATGIPIVTDYNPTDDNTQYPGRNTLEESYNQIFADLAQALDYISAYEATANANTDEPAPMSPYITSDVVKAMVARTALAKGDYQTALSNSEEVINSRLYTIEPSTSLRNLWSSDYSSELLMIVTMNLQHRGYATGSYYLQLNGNPMFIPTKESMDLFTKEGSDRRLEILFANRMITLTESSASVKEFAKYPGNWTIMSGANTFYNMGKPFRISEQYLIAAESAAALNQDTKANKYLNDLKSRRISGYSSDAQTGYVLRTLIREERHRELFGEGFRFGDLKRWGEGFERSEGQDNTVINTNGNVHIVEYQPNDYRWVWPIPKAEIDANPQLKTQQNPGY